MKTPRPARIALAALAAALIAGGCGGAGQSGQPGGSRQPGAGQSSHPSHEPAPPETVQASHCPPGEGGCRATEGRIVYEERVDPDGDGDAHLVVIDPQSVTLPGMTVIDIRKGLRPHPLPDLGELVSAAGPVESGTYGQHQIHAVELHVAGR